MPPLLKLKFFVCALFASTQVHAAISVLVTDQNKQALEHAIIEIAASDTAKQKTAKVTLVMDQINKAFEPHLLATPINSYVSFPNSDDIRHHVYSFSKAKPFE